MVHLAVLRIVLGAAGEGRFALAQTVATLAAMTWNFIVNNLLTYRDARLSGLAFVTGLLWFYVVCGIGAVANVGIATWVYNGQAIWWLAGLAGAMVGAVWNYAASSTFVWRRAG
jgi:dolichol-phosphate mannosyltransferase